MTNASVPHRLLSVILAAAFVAAVGSEAYGLRACPIHDSVPGARSRVADGLADRASAPVPGPATGEPAVAGHADFGPVGHGPADDHADATCTCVGDCCEIRSSTGAVVAVPAEPVDRMPVAGAPGPVDPPGVLSPGSRHDLFELHLPNAPPPLC